MVFRRPLPLLVVAALTASPLLAQTLFFTTFADVPEGHMYFDAIEDLADRGVVEGYSDATYRPDNRINRAEFTKIIIGSVAGKSEIDGCLAAARTASDASFSDVKDADWFARYVCAARRRGVIAGYPDGTFKPGAEINFVEAAKIVVKAVRPASSQSLDEPDAVWYRPFVLALSEWAAIPVAIQHLEHPMTRGEMAEILYRLGEKRGKPSRTYEDFTSHWATYVDELNGIEIPYPRVSPQPVLDADGEATGMGIAYESRSLWRLHLGARIDCPPADDDRCAEYEWTADAFTREAGDDAVDALYADPQHIAVITDERQVGKRTIVYAEKALPCTHLEALAIGPDFAVRLHWFCGGGSRDVTSRQAFDYMARNISFFGTQWKSSISSSRSSSRPSSPASSLSSSTQSSSAAGSEEASSAASEEASSAAASSIASSSKKSSASSKSRTFWWSQRSTSRSSAN
jgi:hypothetical protein